MKNINNSKRHYLVYMITNKINGMIYIGKHETCNLYDSYMGSGTYLRRAIEKYGIKNFEKQILFDFNNEKDMLDKERELVNEEFVKRRDTYNCILGGSGVFTKNHGNNGTNDVLKQLNNFPRIEICNPYTKQKKRIYNIKDIPQDYIDAGWEKGSLSKFNTTLMSYKDMQISVRKFSQIHRLKEKLVYDRLMANWTIDEILSVPEECKMFKSFEELQAAKKAKLEKTKACNIERRQLKQQQKLNEKKQIAIKLFKEYQSIGKESFAIKHKHDLYKCYALFRKFIPEYIPRPRKAKCINVYYNGKTQSLTAWCKELNLNRWDLYKCIKKGISIIEYFDSHI